MRFVNTLSITRRDALAIAKALATIGDTQRDHDLVRASSKIDDFLTWRSRSIKRVTVTGRALNELTASCISAPRGRMEFELDTKSVNVLIDGETVLTGVTALEREPGLIRAYTGTRQSQQVHVFLAAKFPASWITVLPPGQKIHVTCGDD